MEQKIKSGVKLGGVFNIVCRRKDGSIKWQDEAKNLVVNVGLQHVLDTIFSAGAGVAPWYLGLVSATPTIAAADTMASHAGWTEFADYNEAARQEYVEVRSNQSLTNAASKATFTISADSSSIGGAFLTSLSTKSGATGTLLCAAAFTGGNKAADDGDTLETTYTFSAGDDGV